jgi:hypothetical protein
VANPDFYSRSIWQQKAIKGGLIIKIPVFTSITTSGDPEYDPAQGFSPTGKMPDNLFKKYFASRVPLIVN